MMTGAWFKHRKVKMILWGAAGVLMAYLAIGSWLSKIEVSEKKVTVAWETLKQNCTRRTQMLPRFSQFIQSNAVGAQPLLVQLNQAYEQASVYVPPSNILQDQAAIKQFVATQDAVVVAFIKMFTTLANVPAVAQSRQYIMMKNELQKIEQQIQFAEAAMQRESEFYNYYITGFIHGWANAISLRRRPIILFEIPTLEKTLQAAQKD